MLDNLPLFWNMWVILITLVGLVFLTTLAIKIYFPKDDHCEEEVVWDETLIEGTSPPPEWWFWLITAALMFSVLYMIFYPGFGNYNGLFDLTNAKQFTESKSKINNKYFAKLDKLDKLSIVELQKNQDAMVLAKNIYNNNCVNCHSKDAAGQTIFPNLKDNEWQWGGSSQDIINTITNGRQASMPAWSPILGKENTAKVAKFIKDFNANKDSKNHKIGKEKYQQFCLGCHGIDGKGNVVLGAPNLQDNIWLYGGDLASINKSIASGRAGIMPPQKDRLSALQVKLLTAWILSK